VPANAGLLKNYIPAEVKACRKTNTEGNKEGSYVWTDGDCSDMYILLLKDKVITDSIQRNIEKHIGATAGRIAEGLYG